MNIEHLQVNDLKASPLAQDLERVLGLLPPGALGRPGSRTSSMGGGSDGRGSSASQDPGAAPLSAPRPGSASPTLRQARGVLPVSSSAEPLYKGGSVVLDDSGDIFLEQSPQKPPQGVAPSPGYSAASLQKQFAATSLDDSFHTPQKPAAGRATSGGTRVRVEEVGLQRKTRVYPRRSPLTPFSFASSLVGGRDTAIGCGVGGGQIRADAKPAAGTGDQRAAVNVPRTLAGGDNCKSGVAWRG